VAALALAGLSNLHQEASTLGELQNHAVVEVALGADLAFVVCGLASAAALPSSRARRLAPPVAADPDVALVIDGDAVVRHRPVVSLTLAAPVRDQVALLIEGENRRSRRAAFRYRRVH